MKIPFYDLKKLNSEIGFELKQAIEDVVDSGSYILGEKVKSFEEEWSTYCECKHAIGVGSGYDALFLALKALGIEKGDEVIVPSHTFIATWLSITNTGAKPIPVEPDLATYCINTDSIEQKITSKTKAIIAVHLYGHPANLCKLVDLSKNYSIPLIEDSAQAHGAIYNGKKVGGFGDLACWSFYPGKNLGALGDAGAITTNNDELMKKIRLLRNYGRDDRYSSSEIGYNSRLDPIQAAALTVKLNYLDSNNLSRQKNASLYSKNLQNLSLILPIELKNCKHVWHNYVIRSRKRDELRWYLKQKGIETGLHYPIEPSGQIIYSEKYSSSSPLASKLSKEVISLPVNPTISSDNIDYICDSIKDFYANNLN